MTLAYLPVITEKRTITLQSTALLGAVQLELQPHMANRRRQLQNTLATIERLIKESHSVFLDASSRARLAEILATALEVPYRTDDQFSVRDASILLADLRGFSQVSEAYPTEAVLGLLRSYFSNMTDIIVKHDGEIDKFMGDSVLALFARADPRENARRAVACAVSMQLNMDLLNQDWKRKGLPELHMGIGITSGQVMAGVIGTGDHAEHAVVGGEVNLVSRIEAFSLRGQVLLSENCYQRCADYVTAEEPVEIHVKGRSSSVLVHEVTGIPALGQLVPRREIRRSLRVRAEIPLQYRVVRNKILDRHMLAGRIIDIGYYGIQAEIAEHLDTYTELNLEIDLSIVGYIATEVYARIVRLRPKEQGFVASIEFTSMSEISQAHIRRFVQLMV